MSLAELRKLLLIWMGKPSLTLFSATGDLVLTDAVSLLVRSIHVVFGHVISGQAVVKQIEGLPVDRRSRPLQDAKVVNCGELVPKSLAKGNVRLRGLPACSSLLTWC